MDKRASELHNEYVLKARNTDQQYCGTAPGTTGPVETKLGTLGEVKGVVVGAFGEGSDDLHSLIHHLAISRVRVAGPQKGRRGQMRTEEAELALTTAVGGGGESTGKAFAGQVGGDRPESGRGGGAAQLRPELGADLGESEESRRPL